ncbi:MAG: hypothetical protein WCH20_15945 [Nitrospira sp.]
MILMKRILLSVILSALLATPALATTINFDSLVQTPNTPPNSFQGIDPPTTNAGPFQVSNALSSVDWTQNQNVDGNTTMAVFNQLPVEGNPSSHLVTFIPTTGLVFSNNGEAGKYSEFTFKGVDIYHDNTAFLQVNIDAFESFDSTVRVFGLSIGIPGSLETGGSPAGWFHYDNAFAPNAIIGSLVLGAANGAQQPGFVFGFDNIRVCQERSAPCSDDPPSFVPPVVDPTVTQFVPVYIGGSVPEASTWWYMMLAAGMIVGIRKFAHV